MRSLGEEGIRVTGIDWRRGGPGFKSRYCNALVCPNPEIEPERLLEFLLDQGSRLDNPAVMIPTSDAFVLFMSRHRAELARWFLFALPDPSVVETIANKRLQYELAERVGVRCPQTYHPQNGDDIARMKHEVEYPVIMKPCYSDRWFAIFGHKGFRVNGPDELERRWAEAAEHGLEVLVQSFIPGPNFGHFLVYAYVGTSNEVPGLFTRVRIRQYPIEVGHSTLTESVRCCEVEQLAARLLESINYRGLAHPDFRRDPRDGQLKLIELNPRIGQNNIHATRAGVNLLLLAYLDLTGQNPEPLLDHAVGVRQLDLENDWRWFSESHQRGETNTWEWLRSIASARVFAYWDWRDPMPSLAASGYGLRYARLPLVAWRWLRRTGRPA